MYVSKIKKNLCCATCLLVAFVFNFQHIIYCTASLRNCLFCSVKKNRWLNYRDLRLVDTNQWSSALWTFMDSYTWETKCDLSKVKCNKSILLVNKKSIYFYVLFATILHDCGVKFKNEFFTFRIFYQMHGVHKEHFYNILV